MQQVNLLLRRTGGLGPPVYYTGLSGARRLGGGLGISRGTGVLCRVQ